MNIIWKIIYLLLGTILIVINIVRGGGEGEENKKVDWEILLYKYVCLFENIHNFYYNNNYKKKNFLPIINLLIIYKYR